MNTKLTVAQQERLEMCNLTISGEHLWGRIRFLSNRWFCREGQWHETESDRPKCIACGIINDV